MANPLNLLQSLSTKTSIPDQDSSVRELITTLNIAGCKSGLYKGDISREYDSTWDVVSVKFINPDKVLNFNGVGIPMGQPCYALKFECLIHSTDDYMMESWAVFTKAGTFLGFTVESVYTNWLKSFCQSAFLNGDTT